MLTVFINHSQAAGPYRLIQAGEFTNLSFSLFFLAGDLTWNYNSLDNRGQLRSSFSVLEGLTNVRHLYTGTVFEVGDRPGDAQAAHISPGGKAHSAGCLVEELPRRPRKTNVSLQILITQFAVQCLPESNKSGSVRSGLVI